MLCREISTSIVAAAREAIPKLEPRLLNRILPWWSKECKDAVKERNRAFRSLKKFHNFQSLVEYKRAQAQVRRTEKEGKKGVLEEVL